MFRRPVSVEAPAEQAQEAEPVKAADGSDVDKPTSADTAESRREARKSYRV